MEYKLSLTAVFAVILRSTVPLTEASPTPTTHITSYIQDIDVSYENGKWVCGGMDCPPETYGCRIERRNNAYDSKKLDDISSCFDEEKMNFVGAIKIIPLDSDIRIDIDVESYIGAESTYSISYGAGGNESAHGKISPEEWSEFKETAAENKKAVDASSDKQIE